MSAHKPYNPFDGYCAIPELDGKCIKCARYDHDAGGYPYVTLEFTDGTSFTVEERGQAGYIRYYTEGDACAAQALYDRS